MKLSKTLITAIEKAEAKALGTSGAHGVNVVPVSTVRIVDDTVWLMNYFMGETLRNILENHSVTFVCWSGLEGIKLKAHAVYEDEGERFEAAKEFVAEVAPHRIIRGVLILTPVQIQDVSPFVERAGKIIC